MKKKPIAGSGADSVLLEVYEQLRSAHNIVKEILDHERYEELSNEAKNAIEGLHSVMYMAEYTAIKEDNEPLFIHLLEHAND